MRQHLKSLICIALFLPIWFLLTAFLHESGHALVGMAYGGRIERFVFWNFGAHVRIVGGRFTPFGLAFMHMAGPLLPFLFCIMAVAFYNKNIKFAGYHICYLAGAITPAASNMFMAVLSVRSFFAVMPLGEDIIHFLNTTGFHPIIVALCILLITTVYVAFCLIKEIPQTAYASVRGWYYDADYTMPPETKTPEHVVLRKRNKLRPAIIKFVLAFSAIFVAAIFIPYEQPSIINVSGTITNTYENTGRTYAFTATRTGRHWFNIGINGQGIVTGVIVENAWGSRDLTIVAAEPTDSTSGIWLLEGEHAVHFVFLADFDAVVDFFEENNKYMGDDEMQRFREVFAHGEYAAVRYSLRVW